MKGVMPGYPVLLHGDPPALRSTLRYALTRLSRSQESHKGIPLGGLALLLKLSCCLQLLLNDLKVKTTVLEQVLKYEALSLGLLHSKAHSSQPLSDAADPTPAIEGPNPFAADESDRSSASNKLVSPNVQKPPELKGSLPIVAMKFPCSSFLVI